MYDNRNIMIRIADLCVNNEAIINISSVVSFLIFIFSFNKINRIDKKKTCIMFLVVKYVEYEIKNLVLRYIKTAIIDI